MAVDDLPQLKIGQTVWLVPLDPAFRIQELKISKLGRGYADSNELPRGFRIRLASLLVVSRNYTLGRIVYDLEAYQTAQRLLELHRKLWQSMQVRLPPELTLQDVYQAAMLLKVQL